MILDGNFDGLKRFYQDINADGMSRKSSWKYNCLFDSEVFTRLGVFQTKRKRLFEIIQIISSRGGCSYTEEEDFHLGAFVGNENHAIIITAQRLPFYQKREKIEVENQILKIYKNQIFFKNFSCSGH